MKMTRRFRLLRWLHLLFRKSSGPKCLVNLYWGSGDLEREMVFLHFIPQVGVGFDIEIRNIADDKKRWRVTPQTVTGHVTHVKHHINIDYGNDAGPHSFQSVEVHVKLEDREK